MLYGLVNKKMQHLVINNPHAQTGANHFRKWIG